MFSRLFSVRHQADTGRGGPPDPPPIPPGNVNPSVPPENVIPADPSQNVNLTGPAQNVDPIAGMPVMPGDIEMRAVPPRTVSSNVTASSSPVAHTPPQGGVFSFGAPAPAPREPVIPRTVQEMQDTIAAQNAPTYELSTGNTRGTYVRSYTETPTYRQAHIVVRDPVLLPVPQVLQGPDVDIYKPREPLVLKMMNRQWTPMMFLSRRELGRWW